MSRERGNLRSCLLKTIHHVSANKVGLIFAATEDPALHFEYRFQLVRANLQGALAQLEKVTVALKAGDYEKAQQAIDEPIEFGHNFPTVPVSMQAQCD